MPNNPYESPKSSTTNPESSSEAPKSSVGFGVRLIILLAVVGLAAITFYLFGDQLSFEQLAKQESVLREKFQANPWLVLGLAFLIYISVTGLSLPGATVLSLSFAWFFGFWKALILISFASTTGATIAFLFSRFLFRDAIQSKFGERLNVFNSNLEREGAFYLFTLRLIPAIPFFVINAVMGLTPMKTWTYWWVSQLGMLPGTIVYVLAGASVPDLTTFAEQGVKGILSWQLFVAFALLGLFPLITRRIFLFFGKQRTT